MKRNNLLIAMLIALLGLPQINFAQDFSDAFRLSFNRPQGTARSAGMGNAFGSLGGDFTSISINPAGSAVYQSGEFVITPGYYCNTTALSLNGTKYTDKEQNFKMYNIGAVGVCKKRNQTSGVVSVNYAIGFNRLANYNSSAFVEYNNSSYSWLDDIVDYANNEYSNGLTPSYLSNDIADVEYRDWATKLAWDNYLINDNYDDDGDFSTFSNVLNSGEDIDLYKTYSQKGHLDEYLFNLSLNFNHNFYLGATVGIYDLEYRRTTLYEEVLLDDNSSYSYYDEYRMDGNGVNFKVGAIFKPMSFIRLGLALHSPTFYDIDDESYLDMESNVMGDYYNYGVNQYSYNFITPWKAVASGAVVFNKFALISADIEYMDYTNMEFREDDGSTSTEMGDLNAEMENAFKNVFNLRLGAELKLPNQFALRAGIEHYGNPFEYQTEGQSSLSKDMTLISCGFGYMVNSFSFNVGYSQTISEIAQGNAQSTLDQMLEENNNHRLLFSFGFRF